MVLNSLDSYKCGSGDTKAWTKHFLYPGCVFSLSSTYNLTCCYTICIRIHPRFNKDHLIHCGKFQSYKKADISVSVTLLLKTRACSVFHVLELILLYALKVKNGHMVKKKNTKKNAASSALTIRDGACRFAVNIRWKKIGQELHDAVVVSFSTHAFYNGSLEPLSTKQTKQSRDPCHGHNIISGGYMFSTPPSAALRWLNKTLLKILMFHRSAVPAASPQLHLALRSFQIYRGPR